MIKLKYQQAPDRCGPPATEDTRYIITTFAQIFFDGLDVDVRKSVHDEKDNRAPRRRVDAEVIHVLELRGRTCCHHRAPADSCSMKKKKDGVRAAQHILYSTRVCPFEHAPLRPPADGGDV